MFLEIYEYFFKISVLKSFARRNIHRKTPLLKSLSNKACNFIKKRHQHRCFPVNIAKFLRTVFLNKTPRVATSMIRNNNSSISKLYYFSMWDYISPDGQWIYLKEFINKWRPKCFQSNKVNSLFETLAFQCYLFKSEVTRYFAETLRVDFFC